MDQNFGAFLVHWINFGACSKIALSAISFFFNLSFRMLLLDPHMAELENAGAQDAVVVRLDEIPMMLLFDSFKILNFSEFHNSPSLAIDMNTHCKSETQTSWSTSDYL